MCNTIKYSVIVITVMTMITEGHRIQRTSSSSSGFDVNFPPYQASYLHPPYQEKYQPFRPPITKLFRQQFYRHQEPIRGSYQYKDPQFFRDYTSYKEAPYYHHQPVFRDNIEFRENSSTFKNQIPFESNRYKHFSFHNSRYPAKEIFLKGQETLDDQVSLKEHERLHEQSLFRDESMYREKENHFNNGPPISKESMHTYRDVSYQNPSVHSYKPRDTEFRQFLTLDNHPDYLKYGNHGFGFTLPPEISSYDSPLNEHASTISSTPSTVTQKPFLETAVSSTVSTNTEVHSLPTTEPKIATSMVSTPVTTVPSVKANTLANNSPTPSTLTTTMMVSMSVTPKQSSDLQHNSKGMATISSSPVMVTQAPTTSFDGNLEFDDVKLSRTSATEHFIESFLKSKLQDSLTNYLFAKDSKSLLKDNIRNSLFDSLLPQSPTVSFKDDNQSTIFNYLLPEYSKNILKGGQSSIFNYLLPTESRNTFKNIQDSTLNYVLPDETKRGLPYQLGAQTETFNYVPSDFAGKEKLSLPSLSIAPLSAISRPFQTINYVSTALPRVPFVPPDTTTSSALALEPLHSALSTGIQNGLTATIPNSIPANMPVSAGIPASISGSIPASTPFNFDQSFHTRQLRQFENARSPPALQLQLGGFGGIDYSMQSSNPPRPMEFGIAKVGLSLPELPRSRIPTFGKDFGFPQQFGNMFLRSR